MRIALLLSLLILAGCGTVTLDPNGVYAGQMFWYQTDATLIESKADLDAFLTWERENHVELARHKANSVTAVADGIRTNAPTWFLVAYGFREAYTNALFSGKSASVIAAKSNALAEAVSTIKDHVAIAQSLTNTIPQQ